MTPPPLARNKQLPRLLCVDDDPVIRKAYLEMFKSAAEVSLAENGVDALARFEEISPRAIFMDLVMPRLDGFGTLKALRENPGSQGIPIMMTSAKTDLQTILAVQKLGATGFMAKPFLKVELLNRLQYLLKEAPQRESFPMEILTGVNFNDPAGGATYQEQRASFLTNFEFLAFAMLAHIENQQDRKLAPILARLLTVLQYFQMHRAKENAYLLLTAVTHKQWPVAREKLALLLEHCRQLSRFQGRKKDR